MKDVLERRALGHLRDGPGSNFRCHETALADDGSEVPEGVKELVVAGLFDGFQNRVDSASIRRR